MWKSQWNACYKSILAIRTKPWNATIIMRCVLKLDISNAREALKANISLESEVKTQIRYAHKSLESKHLYRIRSQNENSLYQQCAWKQISLQNLRWKCEFAIPANRLKANTYLPTYRIWGENANLGGQNAEFIINSQRNYVLCNQRGPKESSPEGPKGARVTKKKFRSTLEDKLLEKIDMIWTPAKTMTPPPKKKYIKKVK